MKAILKQVRISPKKANLVAQLVRNKNIGDAVALLRYTPKKAAPVLRKLIESAAANAENNFKQDKESLHIKEIIVTEGPTYKRRMCISRGRTHPILKRTSHITVKLEAKEMEKAKTVAPKKASAKKEEKPKAEVKAETKSEVKAVAKTEEKPKDTK